MLCSTNKFAAQPTPPTTIAVTLAATSTDPTQLVTVQRDRNPPPSDDVMAGSGSIFQQFSNYICNINTNATATLASKADEGVVK